MRVFVYYIVFTDTRPLYKGENMKKCCICEINTEQFKEFEDEIYCPVCYEKEVKKCADCSDLILKADGKQSEDGDWYCEDCYWENFSVCSNCNGEVYTDDVCCSSGGEHYCGDCYDEIYATCYNCGEEVYRDDGRSYNGCVYCSCCYSDRFSSCDSCGETTRNDDIREDNGNYYCNDCYEEETNSVIEDYGFRPEPTFKKLKWEDDLFMGIELEVQNETSDINQTSEKLVNFLTSEGINKHFYLKHDGSIGNNGFEIVSHPFTIQYGHKSMKWYELINWLKRHKFSSHKSGKCGLHIHLNRPMFSELDISKLRIFFSRNQNEIYKFSKRSGNNDKFCKYEAFDLRKFLDGSFDSGRYWAVNLNSTRDTIELRAFRGTLDYKRFLATIQFAHAISNFVKIHGLTSFLYGEGVYRGNSWRLFTDYCKEKKYKHLVKYLQKEKLCV